ncbi:hypothetical protein M3181_22000 [Mesobacillus maritimus]|uniref:hypothetical protein n=1 Tax=Mesobacillus maritimus TaxID=1643336 RepID=UPI00203BD6D2|nr:hypothetical protein [Mesobacillus maritimus]MCM3671633.1 hypothetical protein [Mesobacillus maritimus]
MSDHKDLKRIFTELREIAEKFAEKELECSELIDEMHRQGKLTHADLKEHWSILHIVKFSRPDPRYNPLYPKENDK